MDKPRLLVFHPTVAPYRIDFFNDLCRAFETRVCLEYWNLRDQTFDYEAIYRQFAFRPAYLPEGSLRAKLRRVWRELEEFRPEVVLTPEYGPITLLAVLWRRLHRRGPRVVVMCDDSYDMVALRHDFSARHRWARRLLAPWADEVVVADPRVRDWYRRRYRKGLFFPIIKDEGRAREAYRRAAAALPAEAARLRREGRTVFLFVGRLVAIKNVATLIEAYAQLPAAQAALVVVGSGPEEQPLRLLARRLGADVLFAGRLEGDALNAWYDVAHCFVLASRQEAFGAVVNEALLAGCYALVSSKAGSACLVEEGVNGHLIDPDDPAALAARMAEVAAWPAPPVLPDGLRQSQMRLGYRQHMEALIAALQPR